MNPKIRELAEQSTTTEVIHGRGFDTTQYTSHFDKEKFAELIVRECAKVIINGGYWSGGPVGPKRQCTPPEIAEMVKDVFGVTE